jgi:choline dehydrogenase-like flavoprotein
VHSIVYDPKTKKATGVRVIDSNTKAGRTYEAKIIFGCASAIGTAQILLNSTSEAFPTGIANRSDQVGRNLMDHLYGLISAGLFPKGPNTTYHGRRPTGLYIPRFRNVTEDAEFLRGSGFQGGVSRMGWRTMALSFPGIGTTLKTRTRKPGAWVVSVAAFGEMLPHPDNRVTLHATKRDKWGIPLVHIECEPHENDLKMAKQMSADGKELIEAAGGSVMFQTTELAPAGRGIHEMGTARMGTDPKTSVLNKYSQAHDVSNLFITDGSAMASAGCQNPSLTYMALSARAAHHAADFLKEGKV